MTLQGGSKVLNTLWKPNIQFVRYRKVNIQKPFPPHFTRATIENVCKPYFEKPKVKDPTMPLHEVCQVNVNFFEKEKTDNPYTTLLGRDLFNWFNHSKMIVFFHRLNMDSDENLDARLFLKSLGMRMKIHGLEVMRKAVMGTKYEVILGLYCSHTAVAFGPEIKIQSLLKGMKKHPKLILLGGILDERLMSRAELEYYGSLGDLTQQRALLNGVLNMAAQSLCHNLNYHQTSLAYNLKRHVELQTSDKKET